MNLRVFGQNAIIYTIGSTVLRFTAFLMLPLYTHFLTKSDFGLFQTLLLTIQIMITIVDVGVRSGIVRFLSEYEKNNKLNKLLGSALAINLSSGILLILASLSILVPIFRLIVPQGDITLLIFLTSLAAVFQTLSINIMAYYRARNEGLKYMLYSLGAAVILIVTNVIFLILLKMNLEGALLAQVITYASVWFVASIIIFSRHGISISKPIVQKLFKFGAPLVFAMSGDLITNTTAVYFLTYFRGLEAVAIYALAFKIAQIANMSVIGPFQMAYEPFVFSHKDDPEIKRTIAKLLSYLLIVFSIVSFGIVYFFRDLTSVIFSNSYKDSYLLLFFILPGMGFMGLQYVAQSLLHIKNKTHITGVTIATVTFVSLFLNYFFIKMWGIYGIISTYNIIMISTALILLAFGMKVFPIKLEMKRLLIGGTIFVLLLSSVYLLRNTPAFIFYSVPILLFAIIIFYLFIGNFFNNKEKTVLNEYLNKIGLPLIFRQSIELV